MSVELRTDSMAERDVGLVGRDDGNSFAVNSLQHCCGQSVCAVAWGLRARVGWFLPTVSRCHPGDCAALREKRRGFGTGQTVVGSCRPGNLFRSIGLQYRLNLHRWQRRVAIGGSCGRMQIQRVDRLLCAQRMAGRIVNAEMSL